MKLKFNTKKFLRVVKYKKVQKNKRGKQKHVK